MKNKKTSFDFIVDDSINTQDIKKRSEIVANIMKENRIANNLTIEQVCRLTNVKQESVEIVENGLFSEISEITAYGVISKLIQCYQIPINPSDVCKYLWPENYANKGNGGNYKNSLSRINSTKKNKQNKKIIILLLLFSYILFNLFF